MSWHCSQALVAEFLAENSSGGEPSVPSKSMAIVGKSSCKGKTTESLNHSRSGTMSEPLTEDRGSALLTWFLAGFRVRTSPPRGKAPGSEGNEVGCGEKWRELSVKFDRVSRSWKTHRCLWEEDLVESSLILPRWGMMRGGVLWERSTPAHLTSGKEFGLWPTIRSSDGERGGRGDLTPRASANENRQTKLTPSQKKGKHGLSLCAAVNLFATPIARDWKSGKASQKTMEKNSRPLSEQIGGMLNPKWVEWLMGWPLGWTDCERLGMDKFPQWLRSHGEC
jgi:hypothetical protein